MSEAPPSLRDRAYGTSAKAVKESEAKRQARMDEENKARAKEREMKRWYDKNFGANKDAKSFDATIGDPDFIEENRKARDGREFTTAYIVFPLKDVNVFDGDTDISEIRVKLPDLDEDGQSKGWSQYSEGAIMRDASEGAITELIDDLPGKRWHFEADWKATFKDKNGFWNGTFYLVPTLLEEGQVGGSSNGNGAAPAVIDPENLSKFIETALAEGFTDPTKWAKKPDVLKVLAKARVNDKALEDAIMKTDVLQGLLSNGLLEYGPDGTLVQPEEAPVT